MAYKRLAVILGNQLFPDHGMLRPNHQTLFFMAEDAGLCTHFQYHKQKLVLFLSAMRSHRDTIKENFSIQYWELTSENNTFTYEDKLEETLKKHEGIETLVTYQIEDKFFETRIRKFCGENNLKLEVIDSPGFITSLTDFKLYLEEADKPFMHKFYIWQRKRLKVLTTEDNKPVNGKWSFDSENRKKLPKKIKIPKIPETQPTRHTTEVCKLVNQLFPKHPGELTDFAWATTREEALNRLQNFLKERFENFGPYEDAIHHQEVFLFHSVLSPYINLGLINPDEVVDYALEFADHHKTHFPSVEGYVRQIIGWREFMRGMYHTHDMEKNFFGNKRKMKSCWYDGSTGIPPLDDSIKKVNKYGYTHHIERLMVLGNFMLLSELNPNEVYKWFMEMFVDSSDWVMVPNVYGMSQFADGGIFATKPYIAGSNYLRKMSDYGKGDWTDAIDGLYWRFVDNHQEVFQNNPRMNMMTKMLDKMNADKKNKIYKAADAFLKRTTI